MKATDSSELMLNLASLSSITSHKMVTLTVTMRIPKHIQGLEFGTNYSNLLIIRSNTTNRSSTIVFNYTVRYFSAVQISHHQVEVRYTKINVKERTPHFAVYEL
jgi:hypothetical protein